MTIAPERTRTIQTYRVYIKSPPQAIWDAITKPKWTSKYGYAGLVEYELRVGGKFLIHANDGMKSVGMPDIISDGEVIAASPPRKLVQTWRMLMSPETTEEGFTHLEYEIQAVRGGVTRLNVTHDLTGAPNFAALLAGENETEGAGGGWSEVLSGLKTLLETGDQLPFQSGPG